MTLIALLKELFPLGLRYEDALQLQAAVFSSADWLPQPCSTPLNRQNICEAFAQLAQDGFITHYDASIATSMRALLPDFSDSAVSFSDLPDQDSMTQRWSKPGISTVTDGAHWQILLDAAYRLPEFYDKARLEQLLSQSV